MTKTDSDAGCGLTNEEFELIASGVCETLDELAAPEPVRRELAIELERLRSRFVLVKPAAGARRL